MKKLLSITIAFLLIFSCFAVTAFAENIAFFEPQTEYEEVEDFDIFSQKEPKATFSENYKKLFIDGEPYSRIDASPLITDTGYTLFADDEYNEDYYTGHSIYVDLTNEQKQEIDTMFFGSNKQRNIIDITLNFKDGSTLNVTFLKDSYLQEYNKVIEGNADQFEIDFLYPDGNIITATKNQLMGEKVTLSRKELDNFYDVYDIAAKNSDGSIVVTVGVLLAIGEDFYYINYPDGFTLDEFWSDTDTALGSIAGKPIYKITDAELLADIESALTSFYEDDYGVLYDDDATETISAVFFIIVFVVIPFVILVIFLIKSILGKGIYKKMYITVSVLCALEIIVFVILAIIITSAAPIGDNNIILGGSDDDAYIQLSTESFWGLNDDTTTLDLLELKISDEDAVMVKRAEYCGNANCSDGCMEGVFCIRKDCAVDDAMSQLGIGEPNGYAEYYNEKTMETSVVTDIIEYKNGFSVEYEVISVE